MSYNLGTAQGTIQFDYDSRGVLRARNHLGQFVSTVGQVGNQSNRSSSQFARFGRLIANAAASMASAITDVVQSMAPLAAKMGAIVAVAAALAPSLLSLLGLIQLAAPAAIAAGAAMLTLKFALDGVSDALKAGLSGDTAEFNKALKKLAPSAQEAVKKLVSLADGWREIKKATQEAFFKGMARDIEDVNRAMQPLAAKWLPRFAQSIAEARAQLADWLGSPEVSQQLDGILVHVERFIRDAKDAVKPLAQAFLDIAEVAAPAFGDLGAGIKGAAEEFAAWIRKLKEDGTLQKWIDDAKKVFEDLKRIAKEVGRIIGAFFKDQDGAGKDALANLKDSLKSLADFLNGEKGQALIGFFKRLGEIIAGIGTGIDDMEKGMRELRGEAESSEEAMDKVKKRYEEKHSDSWIDQAKTKLREWAQGLRESIGIMDGVVSVVTGLPGRIAAAIASIPSLVAGIFIQASSTATGIVQGMINAVVGFLGSLPGRAIAAISSLAARVAGVFTAARTAAIGIVTSMVSSVVSVVATLPGRVAGAVGNLGGVLFGAGRSLIQGLLNGISSMAGSVIGAALSIANQVKNAIAGALRIGSPSKVMIEMGIDVGAGLVIGIEKLLGDVARAAERLGESVLTGLPKDMSANVQAAISASSLPSLPALGTAVPTPAAAAGPVINQVINAPATMNAKETADFVARRVLLTLG